MDGTQFLVQWDEHPSHLATRLGYLLEHQSLVDVTLMCNTHTLKVHRAVLAACSPYFERQLGNHPLIVLKDMKFSVLKSLVEFMYCGETSVSEENLTPLLEAAKFFEVKGLSSMTKESLCSPGGNHSIKTFNGTATPTTSAGYGRGSGRGRGRGRGRPPLNPSSKIGSPTESAQILLSLSGNSPNPQLYTSSKNVKIDTNIVSGSSPTDGMKPKPGFEPRRRGRKRGALNTAFRDRIMRDVDTQLAIENLKRDLSDEADSPLLSSLLAKPDQSKQDDPKFIQQLKDIGLPTNMPILIDNGDGKLLTLTEDVLKSVVDSDGNLQLQVADTNLNKVKKPPRPFIVKEMRAMKSDDEDENGTKNVEVKSEVSEEPINDEVIENLKNGGLSEAELEPDAVVLFEVTDNKKVEKFVLSAKDVSILKSLNEQLAKQKKELSDITKKCDSVNTIDVAGTNTKIAELKLKIGKTKSILSQFVYLKEKLKNLSGCMPCDTSDKRPLSEMVHLEFIDGNGEKIEGYQVHGTLVDKSRGSTSDHKDNLTKDGDLLNYFDRFICGDTNHDRNSPLLGENSIKKLTEKREDEMLSGDNCEPKEEMSYQLVSLDDQNENISYDQIEAMMSESSGNIVIEEKNPELKYIIDNDGNIMNQDENYVVYESGNVIYDNPESVLPDISEGENSSNFVVSDRVIQNEGTEYIVEYNDKSDLGDDIKGIDDRGEYIVYHDANKEGYEDDGLEEVKEGDNSFVIYPGESKELEADGETKSPTKDVPFAVGLVPLKDALEKFQSISEHQPRKTRSNSMNGEIVGMRRRSSGSSDNSDLSDKKRKLDPTLIDGIPSDEAL
ncbi:uncharacterized protein [Halyomorpha halys]|uniref:uncharacterized protein n=1 Tax=Halyomorpha halys TaxID=286706 RepID=UPI0006D5118B|nr:uncharacterized protein LOC106688421 [Halyomorpha halys]XP_014288350.1 uncharacterized protein LOC106688421 [Halyomorpha halys]XP_014288351.1 uncharacterized protein LOC106688421 [Halyomorpha halys]